MRIMKGRKLIAVSRLDSFTLLAVALELEAVCVDEDVPLVLRALVRLTDTETDD